MNEKYKQIKKKLNLTDEDIARMFGYKNRISFVNSTRKNHIVNGIVELYELMNPEKSNS